MIDLHIHLDGSIRPQTLVELAREQDAYLPTYDINKIKQYMVVDPKNRTMREYLKRYDLSLAVLQSKRPIRRVVSELVRDLDRQGVLYAEIRLTPQSHILRGLSQSQVVEAALEGLELGMEYSRQIKANLILCTMRGVDEKDNFETIVEASRHLGHGVAGMDLTGNELACDTKVYSGQFMLLKEEGIPFTVHAGALAGPESIYQAVECGARRIGHGVRAREDKNVVRLLKERGIYMEMCPASNIQSGLVGAIEEHPIREYFDEGLKVAVCTDDMTICDTSLTKEYALLKTHLNFTDEEIRKMNEYAIDGAFLSHYRKDQLRQRFKEITAG